MPKINWKSLLFFGLLIYSRFINLPWGLPYQFHPDERNMAIAIQQLNWQDGFNPHFFAYGQFPLYLGYLISGAAKLDVTLSLRIISAAASLITFFILLKIIKIFDKKMGFLEKIIAAAVIIFSPYAIQFAHFGTTESILMLFYSLIVFYSLKELENKRSNDRVATTGALAFFSGLAMATKVSAGIFVVLPAIFLFKKPKKLLLFFLLMGLTFIIFSPYNFLRWSDFINSMGYESDVAFGRTIVFYIRQFSGSIPVLFQFQKIFPYALGIFQFILFLAGFMFLSWKDKKTNLLRLAFLIYFFPNAFLFAKWTRFMAPAFPVMTMLAVLFLLKIKNKIIFYGLVLAAVIPGILYISVYQKPDTRLAASNWIYKNIPENSYILSETANVVDIPVGGEKNYQVISFNFYELDNDTTLQTELKNHLAAADYIFVPSRRIFANHPKNQYPLLNNYYENLNSGALGFKKVAEFSSGLRDEAAEETWTVFDHPTVRIYKRI